MLTRMLLTAALLALHPALSLPALAQDAAAQPGAEIHSSPAMDKAIADYKDAIKGLNQEQLDHLAGLDKELAVIVAPAVQVANADAQLKVCIRSDATISANPQKYMSAFTTMRDETYLEQEELWGQHKELRKKVKFVDQKILEGHAKAQAEIMTQTAAALAKAASEAGQIDCAALRQTLAYYF